MGSYGWCLNLLLQQTNIPYRWSFVILFQHPPSPMIEDLPSTKTKGDQGMGPRRTSRLTLSVILALFSVPLGPGTLQWRGTHPPWQSSLVMCWSVVMICICWLLHQKEVSIARWKWRKEEKKHLPVQHLKHDIFLGNHSRTGLNVQCFLGT